MNICFVSYSYPSEFNNSEFVFVKQLVEAIARQGHHCQVIAPFSISHYRHFTRRTEKYECGKGTITVLRPNYFTFSNLHIGRFFFSSWLHKRAIARGFRLLRERPEVIYGHFWSEGFIAYQFAKRYGIPLFVATGESIIDLGKIPGKDLAAFRDYVCGVICVSSKNRDESINLGLTTIEKCFVFPNAIDSHLFYKRDKTMCRNELGVSKDAFVVVFVGWFNERKGPLRLSKALEKIDGCQSFFIGKGNQDPQCKGIIYKGHLPHEDIPLYLNAADAFVLPTQHEGCCNALIEAMACGLPIISSNRSFNWDVLDESNSIMIDPESIDQIANAIILLRDDIEKRKMLGEGALKKAESLTIENRAKAIIRFINDKINAIS